MISGPPDYDPKTVWQNQKEHSVPSFDVILNRVQQLERKTHQRAAIFSVAMILYIGLSISEDVSGIEATLWWVGVIRFALLVVWVYYLPVGAMGTNYYSPISLQLAAMTPVFDFYRKQLERRRDYFQDDYRKTIQAVFLSIAFILYSVVYPALFLVFGIPLAVGALVVFRRRKGELPTIRREIEMLKRFQKD